MGKMDPRELGKGSKKAFARSIWYIFLFYREGQYHGEPKRPGGPGVVGNDREEIYSGSRFGTKLEEGCRRKLRTSCVQISGITGKKGFGFDLSWRGIMRGVYRIIARRQT